MKSMKASLDYDQEAPDDTEQVHVQAFPEGPRDTQDECVTQRDKTRPQEVAYQYVALARNAWSIGFWGRNRAQLIMPYGKGNTYSMR